MSARTILLKHKLRVLYRQYCRYDQDCGNAVLKPLCRELNETLDKLAKIDPATPTRRF